MSHRHFLFLVISLKLCLALQTFSKMNINNVSVFDRSLYRISYIYVNEIGVSCTKIHCAKYISMCLFLNTKCSIRKRDFYVPRRPLTSLIMSYCLLLLLADFKKKAKSSLKTAVVFVAYLYKIGTQ